MSLTNIYVFVCLFVSRITQNTYSTSLHELLWMNGVWPEEEPIQFGCGFSISLTLWHIYESVQYGADKIQMIL